MKITEKDKLKTRMDDILGVYARNFLERGGC